MLVKGRGGGVKMAAWAAVIGTAILAVAFATRFGTDPSLAPSPLLGKPAPDLVLPNLEGSGEVALAGLQGKIVVVNFFASWCLECRVEHAALIATSDAYADSGVQFIEVSYEDDPDDTRSFLDELGRSSASAYVTDPGSRAAISFGLRGVPETYFIDPSGVIRGRITGPSNAIVLGEALDAMLRGETPGEQQLGEVQGRPQ
jgi:cytochrome c biogenesis protein CcmG/thiol:disulfide interchange protein DsbE